MTLDDPREDAVVTRMDGGLELRDALRLPRHQRADEPLGVTERADAEEPRGPVGERAEVTMDERLGLRRPGLVIHGAAEHTRVVVPRSSRLADMPQVDAQTLLAEPGRDARGDTAGSTVAAREDHEQARR